MKEDNIDNPDPEYVKLGAKMKEIDMLELQYRISCPRELSTAYNIIKMALRNDKRLNGHYDPGRNVFVVHRRKNEKED